jgi:CDGSH iron-sulfur domain-containing protein 3
VNHATITPTDNGRYLVQGTVILLDAEGNAYEVTDTTALCRCGLSATKPFCDGSHEKTYFKAVNRAPTSSSQISAGGRQSIRPVTASTLAV